MNSEPIITHCCHCRRCQKATGSAFCINSMIETEQLSILQGVTEVFHAPGCHKVVQCSSCKSALWSYHPGLGESIAFVGIGRLDEGERLSPEAHYFTRSKHPWVELPAHLPAFEELGDPAKPSARARVEAALARSNGA